jgi:hypothetical protein
MLDKSTFPRRLRKHVRRATKKNALLAEGAIKTAISAGKFAPNASMTQAIKGSAKPLVDTGQLFKSINGEISDWDEARVGVLKNQTRRDKDSGEVKDLVQIATILHNGAVVDVSDKMRRFFAAMFRKHQKGEVRRPWRPIKATTRVIVIPKRPFLLSAFTHKMNRRYKEIWEVAVDRAMSEK